MVKQPHPIQFVVQDALFWGLDGFGRMGKPGGINPRHADKNLLAFRINDVTSETVRQTASHALHYRIDEISKEIARTMLEKIPPRVLAEMIFPKLIKDKSEREYAFATSVESYGSYSRYDYDTTCHRVINGWSRISGEKAGTLLKQQRDAIIDAMVSHVAAPLEAGHAPGARDRLRNVIRTTLEESKTNEHLNAWHVKEAGVEKVAAAVRAVLTPMLEDIIRDPEPLVAQAHDFLARQDRIWKQEYAIRAAPVAAPVRPGMLGRLKASLGRSPPPADTYKRPPVEPAPALIHEDAIVKLFQQVMQNELTLPMRAIVMDSGAQVLLTTSHRTHEDYFYHDTTSYSNRIAKQLHFLQNHEEGVEVQALSPKVMLEEIFHYVVNDPRVMQDESKLQAAWMEACASDLGVRSSASPSVAQIKARDLLKAHFGAHTPVWDRRTGKTDYLAELSYEIYQAVRAGVEPSVLKEALPKAYPLFEVLLDRINSVGVSLLEEKKEVAALAESNTLPDYYTKRFAGGGTGGKHVKHVGDTLPGSQHRA